jgi:NADPH2:quinone reductase
MVSFGNASGPVNGINLGILGQKGSLYVTRPMLWTFVDKPEKLQASSNELFNLVIKKKLKLRLERLMLWQMHVLRMKIYNLGRRQVL